MNLTTAVDRIAHLIPTYRSRNLVGTGVWVLTPPTEVPEYLRVEQRDRNVQYMRTGDRTAPSYAPRYVVTSYGVLIAWVTLDGRTHYASDAEVTAGAGPTVNGTSARRRAIARHLSAVRAVWPERFALDPEDGEVTFRHAVNA